MTGFATASGRVDGSLVLPVGLAATAAPVLLLLPYPLNVFFVAAGAALVVAVVKPPLALGALVASLPLQSIGQKHPGLITLTLTGLAIALACAVRLVVERREVRFDRVAVAYAACVAVLALSVVNARDWAAWGTELYRWWSTLLAYVVALNILEKPEQARPVLVGTALGVAGASCYGIVQAAQGIGPASFEVGGVTRAYATFGQPNPFAGYLALTVPLLVALAASWALPEARRCLARTVGAGLVALSGLAAGLGLVALLLTQSRGGWIGAGCGLAAVVWLLGGRVRWLGAAAAIVVLAGAVLSPLGGRVVDRLEAGFGWRSDGVQVTPANFAVQERLAHWRAAWAMAERHPFLGVGAGNFSEHYRDLTPVWRFRLSQGHAHNAFLQAAAQSGLLGLAAYLTIFAAVGMTLTRHLRSARDPTARALVVGVIGLSLAFAVHNVFDYLHVLSLPVQLVVAWAVAAAVGREATEPARRAGSPRPGPIVAGAPVR